MRSPWVLVSIVLHSLAITAAAIAPLVASVDLPDVHSPLPAYISAVAKNIELPPPPPARGLPRGGVGRNAPPIEAPPNIGPEPVVQQLEVETGGPGGIEPGPTGLVETGPIGEIVAPPLAPIERPPVRVTHDVRMPRKIVDVAPVYPAIAINARKEGVVILEAIIDTRGYVKNLRVLRSIPLLDEAAMDAVRQWRYTPTLLNGQPVSVIMTVTVNFKLGK